MDITKQAVSETATIHVKDAAGTPLYSGDGHDKPVQIVIYGPGSKAFAAVEARQSSRSLKRMQDNDGKIAVATPEERVKETAEDLAAITVRFDNLTYPPAGEAQGQELYKALYLDQSLGFITRQVTKFVGDWGNFRPA